MMCYQGFCVEACSHDHNEDQTMVAQVGMHDCICDLVDPVEVFDYLT